MVQSFHEVGMAEEHARLLVDLRHLLEGLRHCKGSSISPFTDITLKKYCYPYLREVSAEPKGRYMKCLR